MIWSHPIYEFLIKKGSDEEGKQRFERVLIDVTDSVPNFEDPGVGLGSVLDEVLKSIPKRSIILDFGAGKLRNTIYLLEKGYEVCSVEFEKTQLTKQGKKMYAKAKKFGKQFNKLVFPHEFFNWTSKFNLILLINVCNIMPVPAERLLVLHYCRNKLKDDGFILWYSQHRDSEYIPRMTPEAAIGDGFYMKPKNRYQTFYRDYYSQEIDEIFLASGLRFIQRYDSHSQARKYKIVGENPLARILNAKYIRQFVRGDKPIESPKKAGITSLTDVKSSMLNAPNPEELSEERLYQMALDKLPAGIGFQTEYHNLMSAIMIRLFVPPLSNPRLEYEINDGRKKIDLVLSNTDSTGLNLH
jgi:hypothetical protein